MVSPQDRSPAPKPKAKLQSHVGFFDPDGDNMIWPSDTYFGFRALNFGILLSAIAMMVIHLSFSYATWDSIIPDPFFRLNIKNISRARHGSDSGAYTTNGEFDEKRFYSMFHRYSKDGSHLTFKEGLRMVQENRDIFDPFGWFAAVFEWSATYIMLSTSGQGMKKEDLKGVYDGSIFYKISKRNLKPRSG